MSGQADPLHPLASGETSAKLFVKDPGAIRLGELVPVFHRWIREGALTDELLIDVAAYEHVPRGPGIVLVCDKAHVSLDERHGRPGVRYRGRREAQGTGEEQVARTLRQVLQAAALLESDPALGGRYRFRTDEIEIGISDRLRAPSNEETLAAVAGPLERVVKELYGVDAVDVTLASGPREPFLATMRVPASPGVQELLGRVATPA